MNARDFAHRIVTSDTLAGKLEPPPELGDAAFEDASEPQRIAAPGRPANLPIVPETAGDPVEAFLAMPMAVVGTPDEAAAKIQALVDQSGGFGAFLFMAHNWANWAATKQSYELFARYVLPRFEERSAWRSQSMDWMRANRDAFSAKRKAAAASAVERHFAAEEQRRTGLAAAK